MKRKEPWWICPGCRRAHPPSFGAADDLPDLCDQCWCWRHGVPVDGIDAMMDMRRRWSATK